MPRPANRLSFLLVPLLIAVTFAQAHAGPVIGKIGGFEIEFDGLIQTDFSHYDSDLARLDGDPGDGANHDQGLRRAELVLEGHGAENLDWVIGYDVHSEKWLDVDASYRIGESGKHRLILGQFKQASGLEELSSTKNNDFISKAMTTNTFAVSRRLGAGWAYDAERWNVSASTFGRSLNDDDSNEHGYAMRGTFAPIHRDGRILHLGLSFVNRDIDEVRLRTRPQADLAGVRLVDTGVFENAEQLATTGLESFWVHGPFKLQGEYMQAHIQRAGRADFSANGAYLSALWNVSGETWQYKSSGVPSTTKPANPAIGRWQLGLRYDHVDLDDADIRGGRMHTLTAGINWYWRNNFKFMLNYVAVRSERNAVEDHPDIISARVQLYW